MFYSTKKFQELNKFYVLSMLMTCLLLASTVISARELGEPPILHDYHQQNSLRAPDVLSNIINSPINLTVDTSQRESVRNFYNALFFASNNIPMGWTGARINCIPGVTNLAYRDATALRVNVIRALAGVPAAITFNDALNVDAQQAALMMSANNQISHTPSSSWRCYTTEGATTAGKSNLSLGYAGPDAISLGYLADDGDNNTAVGHRRWLLYPQTQVMGTGDIEGDATYSPVNVLLVMDDHVWDTRPATRDDFVAWPPPHFIPYSLGFARWSLSYPNADFSTATVSMSRNGVTVPVKQEQLVNGYGENTIVWRPTDSLLTDPAPLASSDATFAVSVLNVRIAGKTHTFNYDVTLFDPARHEVDTVIPQIMGTDHPLAGENNTYNIIGTVPLADSYDWFYTTTNNYNAVQDAENGLGAMIAATSSGYVTITNAAAAHGVHSYHLNHPNDCTSQTLTINNLLMPGINGAINFYSRLGLATIREIAAVQISVDSGHSWQDLYTQTGTDDWNERVFTLRSVSLAAFAGKMMNLRFNFKETNSCYLPGQDIGWYLDDITFIDTSTLATPIIKSATADGVFTFRPPTSNNFILGARGTINGHPLEWGDFKLIQMINDKASQTIGIIRFSRAPLMLGATITTSAVATSGLPVRFKSTTPTICTTSGQRGRTVTAIASGICIIVANQAGNADYDAAPRVMGRITVKSR